MSPTPLILVTGASGSTGSATARELLARGARVRAMVRVHDSRSADLGHRGAEIALGSLTSMADVRKALDGARRAYFVAPFIAGALDAATVFACAAEEARVETIVTMSQWLADPDHPSLHTRRTWLADQVFAWMPTVGTVTVNPGFFAENYMAALEPIAQFGMMTMPLGHGFNAPPSNEDLARVIACILMDPTPHIGKVYRPTGPDLLSPTDIAAAFSRVLDRSVAYRDIPFTMMAKVAKSLGYSDFQMAQLTHYIDEYRRGTFAIGAPTTAVEDITGVPAESFEVTVGRYVAASNYGTAGIASRAGAMGRLLKALATRAPSARRYARTFGADGFAGTSLAIDSPRWSAARRDPAANRSATVSP